MKIPPRRNSSKERIAQADFSRSETFADGMDAIASGVRPFETTLFERTSNGIDTLTITPRRGAPKIVHDTSGRIPDEKTMAEVIADAEVLGIYPFDPPTSSPDS